VLLRALVIVLAQNTTAVDQSDSNILTESVMIKIVILKMTIYRYVPSIHYTVTFIMLYGTINNNFKTSSSTYLG